MDDVETPGPPRRDRLAWLRESPATGTLVITLAAVWVLTLLDPEGRVYGAFAKVNGRVRAGEVWRIVTASFLHAGLLHLAFNCMALLAIGRPVERLYGGARMLAVFLGGGACGYVASVAFTPGPSVGASAGVFALLGVLLAFAVRFRRRLAPEGRRVLLREILVIVGLNLALGLSVRFVDNAAHLGGLAGGFVIGLPLRGPAMLRGGRSAPGPTPRR